MRCGTLRREGEVLLHSVWRADTWWLRLRGLLGRAPLQSGQGLLIEPCNSVHTFAMGYPLDLLFFDRDGHVLEWRERIRPWRGAACLRAHATLELAAGSLQALQPTRGERLAWWPAEASAASRPTALAGERP
ncbi:DUF192 domain-containing protein [Xanthomonas campestris pv. phormiicola]|nr:DUF192 domain-containing protein [Xanthomonas campestris pv. phormiicola]UYC16220.1 DUF192 domain-containing protein [Xanthomonas campestris pv. phormiicola]